MLMIENVDQRSKDYAAIRDSFRPGHADLTYQAKYGIRDYKGGGRSSARETAARVAAGAVARKIIPGVTIRGALVQMGPHRIDRANWDWAEVDRNPFFTPDAKAAAFYEDYLDGIRKSGSSIGAVIEVTASGVPAGWGAPYMRKLDQDIASADDEHQCRQGCRDRSGFRVRRTPGEDNADEIRMRDGKAPFPVQQCGRNTGRHLDRPRRGGALRGEAHAPFSPRAAACPATGEEVDVMTKGRPRPFVGIRAVPVGEAMMALVLADHFLGTGARWDQVNDVNQQQARARVISIVSE